MSTDHDKRELLKLKQGLIEDSEVIRKDETEPVKLTGKKAVENFFYHNKIILLMIGFFSLVGIYLVYDFLSREKADVSFMFLASSEEASAVLYYLEDEVGEAFERFCPDFDNNGYVHVQPLAINYYTGTDYNSVIANQTRVAAEIAGGSVRIFIGNREAFDRLLSTDENDTMTLNDIFLDLSLHYARNENITEQIFYKLSGSKLEALMVVETGTGELFEAIFPEDMYIALLKSNMNREASVRAQERALTLLDNIVYGNIIN